MLKTIITFVSFLYVTSISATSFEELIVFPGDTVNNKSIASYANKWWQWTYTMPRNLNPVRDMTGANCASGQTGEVWFLAGDYGSSKITRSCTVPEGKYIFFPVINMLSYPQIGTSTTCDKSKKLAALNNDELLMIDVRLNDSISSNPALLRVASEECFNLLGMLPENPDLPEVFPSATDGYWVMLKPLPTGDYKLSFKAKYNREKGAYSKMVQDIEYNITIK